MNEILLGDSVELIKKIETESVHEIISDIPYGISCEDWDVLHNNKNSALLGASQAQIKAGNIFKHRGKPLNGWSEADKKISKEYQNWCETWAEEWLRVLKPGASAFIFAGRRMAHRCICALEDAGFIFKDMIAWNKEKAAYRAQNISKVYERRKDFDNAKRYEGWKVGNLRPLFEPILWFMKPYKIGSTLADNILKYGLGAYNENIIAKYKQKASNNVHFESNKSDIGLHSAQKPLQLIKFLVELISIEGQVILDPFAGSGTTLLACKELNRNFIGFENNKIFIDIAKNRLSNFNDKYINLFYNESEMN